MPLSIAHYRVKEQPIHVKQHMRDLRLLGHRHYVMFFLCAALLALLFALCTYGHAQAISLILLL